MSAWIAWNPSDGKPEPVGMVEIQYRDPAVAAFCKPTIGDAAIYWWGHLGTSPDIVAYRRLQSRPTSIAIFTAMLNPPPLPSTRELERLWSRS